MFLNPKKKLGKEIRLSPSRFNSAKEIVPPAEKWDCSALPEMFVAKIPLHGDFALWVLEEWQLWWMRITAVSALLPFSQAAASDYQQAYFPRSPSHTLWALVIYKCNPLLHTYTNCLQLEVAAMTFLWEMKISGGAEQPILDSVVN